MRRTSSRFGCRQGRRRPIPLNLIVRRIDFYQHIAGFHDLIIFNMYRFDIALNFGAQCHDRTFNSRIVRRNLAVLPDIPAAGYSRGQ